MLIGLSIVSVARLLFSLCHWVGRKKGLVRLSVIGLLLIHNYAESLVIVVRQ